MCGLAGVSLKSQKMPDAGLLDRFSAALAHRGPDGQGRFTVVGTGLLHRRLSIIDLEGGAQPIETQGSGPKSAIICNGEIYNFKQHQAALRAKAIPLATQSDSEVPLHLYRLLGIDFIKALSGMYAFALYDGEKDVTLLARDPFGIKPLYYAQTAAGTAFASEPSALVQAGWITGAVNPHALPSSLNQQYHAGEDTLFRGIFRVKPGELLVLKQGEIVERHLFPPDLPPAQPRHALSEKDALAQLDAHLERAVAEHLQSEVPYGAFLSGGIDSSALVTKMAQIVGHNVQTYTVGFADNSVNDERSQARFLAETLKTAHHEITFTEQDFWHRLPELATSADDLVADYAILPSLKLAEAARRDVTVILSGEGGDEIFGGYGRYRAKGWQRLLPAVFQRPAAERKKGDSHRFAALFRDPAIPAFARQARQKAPQQLSPLQQAQWHDIQGWLRDDLLIKTDRCLMHHSLEGRVPFLDKELAAFAFSLPDALKVKGRLGKVLLRRWLEQHHGGALDVWGKKRGFTVPVQSWLNQRREALGRYLGAQPGLGELLHQDALRALCAKEFDKKAAKLVFTLTVYGLWHDIHIRGEKNPTFLE